MSDELPHSALYFGDTRDHWWNDDFIALMAQRLELTRHRRVLDVGCGYGHWARVWLPHLAPGARLTGIDPESRSVDEARSRTAAFAAQRHLEVDLDWHTAHVEALPFADGAFDLVTAQTVLIHVRDVRVAIAEMYRVLAPGGLILLAEPNNLGGSCANLVTGPDVDVERLLALVELEARVQRGKYLLGEGFNSAGEYLVGHFDPARFRSVRSWLCDRPYPLSPPYTSPQAKAEIAEHRAFVEQGIYGRPRAEALRYYLAGGGELAGFERAWARGLTHDRERVAAIDAGTYATGGGHVFHVIAATRRDD